MAKDAVLLSRILRAASNLGHRLTLKELLNYIIFMKIKYYGVRAPKSGGDPMELGELYSILGGDGDQRFFGTPKQIRLIKEPWFNGLKDWPGEAMLFKIEGGDYDEKFVALTPRTTTNANDAIMRHNNASAVVHIIRYPGFSFTGKDADVSSIGMGVLIRVTPKKSRE